jgi:glycosyltransferase involved in cell wall biosynthesis
MIRILNIIDTGGPGGAETVFLQTATRLNPGRFVSTAVVSRDGWLAERLRECGVEPHVVPAAGSFNLGYLLALANLARKTQAQVILSHLYGSAVYGSVVGTLLGLPVIAVLHGQTDISRSSIVGSLKSWLVRRLASRIVFVSANLRRDLADQLPVPDSKALVIPNGVDIQRFDRKRDISIRSMMGLGEGAILIGAIGNIRRPKDYPTLLRAAALLCETDSRLFFAVGGEGQGELLDDLLKLRDALGLRERIAFLGLQDDVAKLLNNLDIYVSSSTTEGFSIVCVEAMACGIPVVATRSGGPETILTHGRTGLLVPVGDPVAMANAIATLVADRDLAARIGEDGRREARAHFSLSTMLGSYESTIEGALKCGG